MSLLVFAATFTTLSEKGQGDWRMGDGQGPGLLGLLGQEGVMNHGWGGMLRDMRLVRGQWEVVGRWAAIHRRGVMTRSMSGKGSEGISGSHSRGAAGSPLPRPSSLQHG